MAKQLGVDLSRQLAGVKVSLGKLQLSADSAEAQQQLEPTWHACRTGCIPKR